MRTLIILLWLFVLCPAHLLAQWRAGIEVTTEWFTGTSGPRAGAPSATPSFRPYRPTWLGLRLEGPSTGVRPALTLRFSSPDLALEGPEAAVVEHLGITQVIGVVPELRFPLIRLREGVRLTGSAGALLERWAFTGQDPRLRAGVTMGAGLEVDLGGRVEGAFEASLGVLPTSIFLEAELPENLEPRSAWRRALRGVLRIRW